MSDAVTIAAIGGFVSLASLAMTLLINRNQKRTESKVDEYHKQVNGMKTELINTTMALGESVGAANNQAITDAKKQKDK